MEFTVENITVGLLGLGVAILIVVLVIQWFYLKGINRDINTLATDTKIFSDSAKSLSLDIKSLTLSLGALGQDIRNLNQNTGTFSGDLKGFVQDVVILNQSIDNLGNSVSGLIESQNRMTTGLDKVEKKQDEAGKSVERISRHFAE